jgi:hypothetical protein
MGNEDDGTALQVLVNCLLNQVLRLGVQRGGGLIQQQNCRLANQRTGNRNSLLLTALKNTQFMGVEGSSPVGLNTILISRRFSDALNSLYFYYLKK